MARSRLLTVGTPVGEVWTQEDEIRYDEIATKEGTGTEAVGMISLA